jgi:curli biogenesis system outer membrane secretion channel CsgG
MMRYMRWCLVAVLLLPLAACVGCGSVQPSDEGEVKESDITIDPIPMVKPPFQGQTIAVIPFINKSLSRYRWLGSTSSEIIPEYLLNAGFRVVEAKRGQLDAVVEELQYGATGMVNPATAAKFGQHIGSKYVFVGSVVNYEEVKTGGKKKIDVLGFGFGRGDEGWTYKVEVAGRLVAVETREIIASKTVGFKHFWNVSGFSVRTPIGGGSTRQDIQVRRETGGRAVKKAFNKLTIELVRFLNRRAAVMPPPPPPPPEGQ